MKHDPEHSGGARAQRGGGHLQTEGQEGRLEEKEHFGSEGPQIHPEIFQTSNFLLPLQRLYLVSFTIETWFDFKMKSRSEKRNILYLNHFFEPLSVSKYNLRIWCSDVIRLYKRLRKNGWKNSLLDGGQRTISLINLQPTF